MATVSEPTRARNLVEAHQKVRSPLERLRGYIRRYVTLEGAALVGVYLALVFWIGLFLDYGIFKISSLFDPANLRPIDWVQILPWWVRGIVLGLLTAVMIALVAFKVLTRLFRTFSDQTMALVLERRFPAELGDRLITAVELSDPEQAAGYGYSPAMVRETIHEAAARVDRVPVSEVFDWRRLKVWWAIVGVLTLGAYLIVGLGFCTANSIRAGGVTLTGYLDLNEAALVWFERNILLRDTIWPRRAHLELVGFPESGEDHIGKGEQAPELHVRALKYIIARAPSAEATGKYDTWLSAQGLNGEETRRRVAEFSTSPPEGWRALTWHDVNSDLLGSAVPDITFPPSWKPRREEPGFTVDALEILYNDPARRAELSASDAEALKGVLEQLDKRASERGMSRTLRKLKVPEKVNLIYTGLDTGNVTSVTLERTSGNEYTGRFGDLKESVKFTVQGEDYSTATRYILVEEPPDVEALRGEEARPAYLYYRLPEDTGPEPLRGRKQQFQEMVVSVQGGEVSLVTVPAGTNLTLIGTATKPLEEVSLAPAKAGNRVEGSEPKLDADKRTFRTTFANVRFKQDFLIKMVDTFGVEGSRHVVVRPIDDLAPRVKDFQPGDLVRKTKEGYLMTVSARIPFVGNVGDDHGLADVRYAYTLMRADLAGVSDAGARYLMGLTPTMAPGGGASVLTGVGYLLAGAEVVPEIEKQSRTNVAYRALPQFQENIDTRFMQGPQFKDFPDALRREVMPLTSVEEQLGKQHTLPFRQLLRDFRLTPDKWQQATEDLRTDFPAWELGLKVSGERRVQPRYRLEVWLESADQAVDSVPAGQRGQKSGSAERYAIILVSEPELLAEIAKEEELKYNELKATYDRFIESEARLVQTTQDLSSASVKPDDLLAMSERCTKILEALERTQRETHDVYVAYERILRELEANRVQERHVERVRKNIVDPLGDLDSAEFDRARDRLIDFRRALDDDSLEGTARITPARAAGEKAKDKLREVKDQLFQILGAMEGLVDVNKLVASLREIDEAEQEQYLKIERLYLKRIEEIFGGGMEEEKK